MSQSETNGGTTRISVSEDKLLRLFAEFKLELLGELSARFKETASTTAVEALGHLIELHALRLTAIENRGIASDAEQKTKGVTWNRVVTVCSLVVAAAAVVAPHIH